MISYLPQIDQLNTDMINLSSKLDEVNEFSVTVVTPEYFLVTIHKSIPVSELGRLSLEIFERATKFLSREQDPDLKDTQNRFNQIANDFDKKLPRDSLGLFAAYGNSSVFVGVQGDTMLHSMRLYSVLAKRKKQSISVEEFFNNARRLYHTLIFDAIESGLSNKTSSLEPYK